MNDRLTAIMLVNIWTLCVPDECSQNYNAITERPSELDGPTTADKMPHSRVTVPVSM